MEKTKKARIRGKRDPKQTEAWILGTGTASLASAFYLIKHAKVPPRKVHILESCDSLQEIWHHKGDPTSGYDQFAGCLPVPIGEPLKELLSCIPSAFPTTSRRASFLHAIQSAEVNRTFATQVNNTCIVVQKDRKLQNIVTRSLDLNFKQRLNLVRFMLKGEGRLGRNHISDFFPQNFFETSFWAIWSAQFGLQPWHSATEFRRALRHYLGDFHNLSILNCLDITGYYQFESIFLPICLFLESLDVDFQFDTKVRAIVTTSNNNDTRTISRLELSQNGFLTHKDLGPHDIVIATLGSTESGAAVGSNDHRPVMLSFDACDQFDENWSLWLTLAPIGRDFGNPYAFCTRRPQSMVESFTITTKEVNFFNYLTSLSQSTLATGALIVLRESRWKLNLCIPAQPVFQYQPEDVRVLWGFAIFPEGIGDYVKKPMLQCSGAEIMTELLKHLNYPSELVFRHTVNIPRVMPRMSAIILAHSRDERPEVVPRNTSNIGLVGQFVEIPQYSCIDMSYAARSAQLVVSRLMGIDIPSVEVKRSLTALLIRILLWK